MNSSVYDKTDKGREEIATRKYQIPARVRTLLVLVDGRRPHDALLSNVAGLGLNEQNIDQLLEQDFIRLVPGTAPVGVAAVMPADEPVPVSARARAVARQAARLAAVPSPAALETVDLIAEETAVEPVDAAEQFRHLYAFYNQHIKSAIGLRGVMLQLKVEKAVGLEEMRALRTPFLQAVIKAKGADMATVLRGELDDLLGGAPEHDEVIMPIEKAAGRGLDFFNMSSGAVEY